MRRIKPLVLGLSNVAILLPAFVFGWPGTTAGQVTVQVTGIRPADTNIVQVSVTLSNTTSRPVNIVDAVDGHPWYHIAPHPELGRKYGLTLAHEANTLKINLAPQAIMTDSFWITNPPSRFRVTVPLRDPAAERRQPSAVRTNLLGKSLTTTLENLNVVKPPAPPDPEFHSSVPAAYSAWVEAKLP